MRSSSLITLLSLTSISTAIPISSTTYTFISVDPAFVRALMTNSTTPIEPHDLDKRVPLGMYQCSLPSFRGDCTWDGPVDDNKCHVGKYGATASIGPDKGLKCTVYKNANCGGTGLYPLEKPGAFDFKMDIWWQATGSGPAPESYRCNFGNKG
jgi:hypothetical protein